MNSRDIFDWLQGIFLVGALGVYIVNKFKSTDDNAEDAKELSEKIEALDDKLTKAMTRMADNVYSLALSVGKLEGRWEGRNK